MIRKLITRLLHDDGESQAPGADARATRAAWGEALAGLGSVLQSIGAGMVRSAYEGAEAELAAPDPDPGGGLEIREVGQDEEPFRVIVREGFTDTDDLREVAREAG
jgi:hypothetical protein